MTREIREMRTNRVGRGPAGGEGPVALLISGGRDDWMLPDEAFEEAGCRLIRVEDISQASEACKRTAPDLVFMPLTLDGRLTSGQLSKCLAKDPPPVVVVVASNDQINTAAEAMRLGAYDCLFKPFSRSRLLRTIKAAVRQLDHVPPPPKPPTRASRPMAAPPPAPAPAPSPGAVEPAGTGSGIAGLNLARRGFVASSRRMRSALEKAASIAQSDATVFLSGEVGTGKTTFAEIIHEISPRALHPMVTLNCATLTAADFEGLMSGPDGVLARAAGGTLYLDEIADIPAEVQPRFARLIETRESDSAGPDVRIVVSTSHDPASARRSGRIRPDLFYRLHVAPIALPPLRERGDDPALIARVRLAAFCEAEGRSFTGFSESAMAMIAQYDWPGNLRELISVVRTVVLMNQGPLVTPEHLPAEMRAGLRPAASPDPTGSTHAPGTAPPATAGMPDDLVGKTLAEIERAVIEATVRAEGGSVPRAARVLDVSPSTLYRKREAWAKARRD